MNGYLAVNAVTRNTKRILILNEELNEQRGMINAFLNPRSYSSNSLALSASESQLFSLNASGSYALFGFIRLQVSNASGNNTVSVNFKDSQANVLSSCIKPMSSSGAQTLDIPFCIYPEKGQVTVNASASVSCTLSEAKLFILGM